MAQDPLHVTIATGPHGRKTIMEIDGVPVKNARSFVLTSDCEQATTLTVTYVNVEASVDGYVDTTAFNQETKTYLAPKPNDEAA